MFQEVQVLISTVGFPIVACLGLGWYVKYQTDNYKAQVNELSTRHNEEMKEVTTALNNNTLAIQRLCDSLERS